MIKHLSFAALVICLLCGTVQAQLRIVNYNVAGLNNSSAVSTVLGAIKDEVVNGVAKPIDVLVLNEVESADITTLLGILNAHGAGTYLAGNLGSTTGAGSVGLIYRNDTVDLVAQQQVVNTSSSGAARGVMRYALQPQAYGDPATFYIYGSHYKAGDTTSDANRRNVEATAIRANSNALGEGIDAIYTGDFNIYRSTEPMWATLSGAGAGQAFDPVNQVGNWHDGAAFKAVHTQNPAGSGGVGGGMDDRFDWQMITGELQDNEGLSILPGSYHAFANNNTHTMNGHINTGTGASPTVLTALGNASDHLPVVAQYQVPAIPMVTGPVLPSRILLNAVVSRELTVENAAGDGKLVVSPIGADELDYTITTQGSVSGEASGSDLAFDGGNVHSFPMDTSSVGSKTGQIDIDFTSPQAMCCDHLVPVNYSVIDHATPSFLMGSEVTTLEYNFGTLPLGSAMPTFEYTINNGGGTFATKSMLDHDGQELSGDLGVFTTGLENPQASIAPGDLSTFTATMSTNIGGSFASTFELLFSDEDAPGELAHALTLTLTGTISDLNLGDFDNDGDVDGRDFLAWQRGESPDPLSAADLAIWQDGYGSGPLLASVAIPEPSAAIILITAMFSFIGMGRCK